jgi:hypothetical protein
MSKEQTSALLSAVIAFIVAVLAIFGYNIIVLQPQIDALMTLAASCP